MHSTYCNASVAPDYGGMSTEDRLHSSPESPAHDNDASPVSAACTTAWSTETKTCPLDSRCLKANSKC